MTGVFIAFDGLPGCGKGTQIKKAFEYIYGKSKKYDNILVTDEPTNGPYGKALRECFKKQKSADDLREEIFELFVKDRQWHVENIIQPCLEKNFVILCDRYKYSSIAYQTVQGNDFAKVFAAHKDFYAPDLALIFDVTPQVAYARMHGEDSEKRKQTDNFRELDFISSLQKHFLKMPVLLPKENVQVIDANKTIPQVFDTIRPLLDKVLFE